MDLFNLFKTLKKSGLCIPMLHNHREKAQAATEYMVIAVVVLAASGIIFFYAYNFSQQSMSASKASESAEMIAAAIDYVYSLGYGTQTVVDIDLPGNIVSASVGNREVVFVIHTRAGNSDVVAPTQANATGTLPVTSGRHHIVVNYTESGVVVG